MYDSANLSIAQHAHKGKHRYAIDSVLFTPGATVATDGRCLIQVATPTPPPDGEGHAVLVPAVTIEAGLAAVAAIFPDSKVVRKPTEAIVEAGRLTLRVNDKDIVCLPFVPAEGTFPKEWEHVIPPQADIAATTPVRINVDPRMLSDLLGTIADMGCEGVELTVIPLKGTSHADSYCKVRIDGKTELGREVLAVLMGRVRGRE